MLYPDLLELYDSDNTHKEDDGQQKDVAVLITTMGRSHGIDCWIQTTSNHAYTICNLTNHGLYYIDLVNFKPLEEQQESC